MMRLPVESVRASGIAALPQIVELAGLQGFPFQFGSAFIDAQSQLEVLGHGQRQLAAFASDDVRPHQR